MKKLFWLISIILAPVRVESPAQTTAFTYQRKTTGGGRGGAVKAGIQEK